MELMSIIKTATVAAMSIMPPPEMQHYDRSDMVQLLDFNSHNKSVPQPLMQVQMQVPQQSGIRSLLDVRVGSTHDDQHSTYSTAGDSFSNALPNPLAHADATQSASHNNLFLPFTSTRAHLVKKNKTSCAALYDAACGGAASATVHDDDDDGAG